MNMFSFLAVSIEYRNVTDRRTDTQTDCKIAISISHVSMLTRDKNENENYG